MIIIICIIVVLVIAYFAFSTKLKLVEYTLISNKVNSEINLALIADLHSCEYGDELMNIILAQDIDAILLAGDIVDDEMPKETVYEFLEYIGKNYNVYYVTGNHEFYKNEQDEIKEKISSFGITVLEGDTKLLNVNDDYINISGVDDPLVGMDEFTNQLETAKNSVNSEYFSLLISHRPEKIDYYNGFDLIVSGHAHGGQWRIPYILNGLYSPNQGFFPKYAGGLYELENNSLIVSRGMSRENTIIPRIFNRPEFIMIKIKGES